MANKLIVAPAPHVHGSESTQKIMRDVLLALTPALVFSVVAFGWSALAVTCISVASCVLFEYLIQKFLLKGPCTVSDLSAVVTGVLLAFNLPASLPWWIVVIGAFVSIAIAKMTFEPFSSSSDLEQDENRSAIIVNNENKSFSINRIVFVYEGTL